MGTHPFNSAKRPRIEIVAAPPSTAAPAVVLDGDASRVSGIQQRRPPLVMRVARRLRSDFAASHFQLRAVQLLVSLIPNHAFGWLRSALYRRVGVPIGRSTYIYGKLELEGAGDPARSVRIGESCLFTTPLYLNTSGGIVIGDRVTIGHHVVVVTDNHRMDDPEHRAGERIAAPVTIEDGAWIGACVTILPGVTLGRGCVVAAGSLVARDVPAHTLVGGVPAHPIKELDH